MRGATGQMPPDRHHRGNLVHAHPATAQRQCRGVMSEIRENAATRTDEARPASALATCRCRKGEGASAVSVPDAGTAAVMRTATCEITHRLPMGRARLTRARWSATTPHRDRAIRGPALQTAGLTPSRSSFREVQRHGHDVDHGRDGDNSPASARQEGQPQPRIDGMPGNTMGERIARDRRRGCKEGKCS